MGGKDFNKFREDLGEIIKSKGMSIMTDDKTPTDEPWPVVATNLQRNSCDSKERGIKILMVGESSAGKVSEAIKMLEGLQNESILIIHQEPTEDVLEKLSIATGRSISTIKQDLNSILMEIPNFEKKGSLDELIKNIVLDAERRIQEPFVDININEKSIPNDSKSFGLRKIGVNQRNNFKKR